jgi:hypothetical protein
MVVGGDEAIATHRTHRERPQAAARAVVHAFPRFGLAVVDPARLAPGKLAAMKKAFAGHMREEHQLRRTRPRYESSDIQAEPWADDDVLTWPLRALGIRPQDNDGAGVVVGIVDSGISVVHPALRGHAIETRSFVAGYRGDDDSLGHGTHVAGVIAGSLSERPRFGIAPAATLRGYRIYGDDDRTDETTMLHAVETAVDDGCHIIVLATGRPGSNMFDDEDAKLGQYLATRRCVMFAAAGNESERPTVIDPTDAPANAPDIYAIGATTREDGVWTKSNGKFVDLARRVDFGAPGQYVTSALIGGTTLSASGTSAACAVAAGAAAVLWSRQPNLTPAELVAQLASQARNAPAADVAGVGSGIITVGSSDSVIPRPSRGTMAQNDLTVPPTNGVASHDDVVDMASRLHAQNPGARMRIVMIEIEPEGQGEIVHPTAPPPDPVVTTTGETASQYRGLQLRWNMSGHSVIAMLAESLMKSAPDAASKAAYRAMQDIMDAATLPADDQSGVGSLAAWPDRIKAPPRGTPKEFTTLGQKHKPDHYINLPYTPGQKNTGKKLPDPIFGADQNVLTALPEWIDLLKKGSAIERLEALAFVLHLVGDLHQPLHCAVLINDQFPLDEFPEADQGGNLIWFEKSGELHALWDGAIVTAAKDIPKAFAKLQGQLAKNAPSKTMLASGDLETWALGTYQRAQKAYDDFLASSAYQGPAQRTDRHGHPTNGQQYTPPTKEYRDNARAVSEECAYLAAYRLADLLVETLLQPVAQGPRVNGKRDNRATS